MFDIPDIFWIFAGIALLVFTTGYSRSMKSGPAQTELNDIRQRLDRIEQHLDMNQ